VRARVSPESSRRSPRWAHPAGGCNVLEWVWDWHATYYYADCQVDPTGPVRRGGGSRVFRGGGWYSDASELRAAWRAKFPTTARHDHLGFRVARSVP